MQKILLNESLMDHQTELFCKYIDFDLEDYRRKQKEASKAVNTHEVSRLDAIVAALEYVKSAPRRFEEKQKVRTQE